MIRPLLYPLIAILTSSLATADAAANDDLMPQEPAAEATPAAISIPEPGVALLGGIGLLVLLRRRNHAA